MTGAGYGDLDVDAANRQLTDDPDVRGWSVIGFLNEITLDGDPMMSVVQFEHGPGSELTVLSGTLPDAGDEVAVGATTADERGIEVGDVVRVAGGPVDMDVRVSGLVVFPGLGPMLADRVGTGTGLYVPEELFGGPDLVDVRTELDGLRTFIGIDLHDGVDRDAAMARLQGVLAGLDLLGAPASTFPEPIRPPEIVDAVSARTVPSTVGLVFAGLAAVALSFASWASVRSRRRELAVLQTLGFTRAQVRQTVWAQSVATAVGALVIGAPLGAVAGQALWRAFADQLGVVPDPTTPAVRFVVTLAAGIVLAFLAALVPAHLASRTRVAEGLRAE
jgi:putative ABC transport system permease protein